MIRAIALSLCLAFSCSTLWASSQGASPWVEVIFKNQDGDSIKIQTDRSGGVITKIELKRRDCRIEIPVPRIVGIPDLGKTEFLSDMDATGEINILSISYLISNELGDSEKTVGFTLRRCKIISVE